MVTNICYELLSLPGIRLEIAKVKVKVAQSCPTLCDPMDFPVNGILQARILEWGAFPFPSPGDLSNIAKENIKQT